MSSLAFIKFKTGFAWALAAFIGCSVAAAAPTAQDRALAEALFREGRKLGSSGKIAEACKKFEESESLDPRLGTKLHLAACYEELGRSASAWVAFSEAAELAERSNERDRAKLARTRAQALEKELSRLTVDVREPPAGVVVRLDSQVIGAGSLGTPLPVDPGEHEIQVSAPGFETWTRTISVANGPGSDVVEVPALKREANTSPTGPVVPKDDNTDAGASQRTLGFVVGGVGLVGLGVGTYFGLRAASQKSDADEHCDGALCTQEGLDGHEDAEKSARLSNIAVGVGLVGVAVGAVLLITAPSAAPTRARSGVWFGADARPSGATFNAGGVF